MRWFRRSRRWKRGQALHLQEIEDRRVRVLPISKLTSRGSPRERTAQTPDSPPVYPRLTTHSRVANFRGFPVTVIGGTSTVRTCVGTLMHAIRPPQNTITPSGVSLAAWWSATHARVCSTCFASRMPNACASRIAGDGTDSLRPRADRRSPRRSKSCPSPFRRCGRTRSRRASRGRPSASNSRRCSPASALRRPNSRASPSSRGCTARRHGPRPSPGGLRNDGPRDLSGHEPWWTTEVHHLLLDRRVRRASGFRRGGTIAAQVVQDTLDVVAGPQTVGAMVPAPARVMCVPSERISTA